MFDLIRLFKQTAAGLASGFGGTLAALAGLAGALNVDVAAGKQLIVAAVAAAIASIASFVGNLIAQLRERGRHLFAAGAEEAESLLAEAVAKIAEARQALS